MDLSVVVDTFYISIPLMLAADRLGDFGEEEGIGLVLCADQGQHVLLDGDGHADVETFDELTADAGPVGGEFLRSACAEGIRVTESSARAGVHVGNELEPGGVGQDLAAAGALGVALVVGVLDGFQQFGRVFVDFVQDQGAAVGERTLAWGLCRVSGYELGLGAVVAQHAHPVPEFGSQGDVVELGAPQDASDFLPLAVRVLGKKQVHAAAEHGLADPGRAEEQDTVVPACRHRDCLLLILQPDDVLENDRFLPLAVRSGARGFQGAAYQVAA